MAIDFALKKGEFSRVKQLLISSKIDIKKYGLIFLYPGFVEAKAMHSIYANDFVQAKIDSDHLADLSLLSGNDFYLGIAHSNLRPGASTARMIFQGLRNQHNRL